MYGVSIEVNLISFGSGEQTSAVHKTLVEQGITVNTINRLHWQKGCYSIATYPSILILGNHDLIQKERLSIITKSSSSIFLTLYSYPLSTWAKVFLSSCNECCAWPCKKEELDFRLQKLCLAINNNKNPLSSELPSTEWVNLNLVGSSAIFQKTLNIIRKSADCNVPVLIEGETGSGKEMVARAIHYLSARRDYPFIPVNCGAIPDHLVENELFGHEKGAYTDAKQSQAGLVSQADGGTLFLDEIEVLSAKGQVVLLRFIEDQNIRPLGSKQCKKVNVRIIAASNIPLSELVTHNQFRQDLLFRLNLLSLRLPPLRERTSDIECLADHFMQKFRKQYEQPNKVINSDIIAWMHQYDWPGNVRELENYIHRQFLLTDDTMITQTHFDESNDPLNSRRKLFDRRQTFEFDTPFQEAKIETINQFEKSYLSWLMSQAQGNVSKAAKISCKERRALGKLLKKHSIITEDYRHHTLVQKN